MKILLVYPEYPNTYWSFKDILEYVKKKASFPPLGLLTIGALLPKEWEKRLVDVNVKPLTDTDVLWADMVFISAMIVQKKDSIRVIKKCKQLDRTVVVGGPLFSTNHEDFLDLGINHFVLDEGEVTLPQFLEDLKEGCPKEVYQSKERPDIKETPIPLWSLIDLNDYTALAVQYSRGCPFNCEFCDIIVMNGRKSRTKTPEQMIKEFQTIYDMGYREGIFIVDDNFIGNKKNVKEMLRVTIKWLERHDYPFSFITEASLNLVQDEELMRLMTKANFNRVFLGIETPELDSLKECGKTQNIIVDLKESVKTLNSNGLAVMGGFIVGFDNDTKAVFDSQIDFIQSTGVIVAMVGILTALPKTALWDRMNKEGRLLKGSTGENTDGDINFIPKMGVKDLQEGYKKILATIYSPAFYYKRVSKFLDDFKPQSRIFITKEVLLGGLFALLKSIKEIGILSKSRGLYWKLLIKTLLTKPTLFPDAVQYAIYGLHFEKTTRQILKKRYSEEIYLNIGEKSKSEEMIIGAELIEIKKTIVS